MAETFSCLDMIARETSRRSDNWKYSGLSDHDWSRVQLYSPLGRRGLLSAAKELEW
jgi:hypothetical protein